MKVSTQAEMLYNNEMHIEKILHLPSLVCQSQNLLRNLPDEFEDVLYAMSNESRHHSLELLWDFFKPKKSAADEEDDEDEDDYGPDPAEDLMNLQSLYGYWSAVEECQFLVCFHKAKRFYSSKTSWHSGGIYYTEWIAAPSVAKALQLAKKWAKEMDKIDLSNLNKE